MPVSYAILFQTLVKPFYRENKGMFVFVFTMMFFIVSEQSGAGLYAYHYSLVTGMLSGFGFLFFVLLIWFLYAGKSVAFVSDTIRKPEYSFLYILNSYSRQKRIRLFFFVAVLLMMPIILYSVLIIFAGLQQHFYGTLTIAITSLILLCVVPSLWYIFLLNNTQTTGFFPVLNIIPSRPVSSYQAILISYVTSKQKILFTGIKVFTCGMLYLLTRGNSSADYDSSYAFMFFNFGMLSHAVLIYRTRKFEDACLSFYRALPVSIIKRLLAYTVCYAVVLIPELVTVYLLTPVHLHYHDAFNFILCSYTLLLLMNSITWLHRFSMKQYFHILLLIFCVQYAFLLSLGLGLLSLLFFSVALLIFIRRYYAYEPGA